MTIHLRNTAIAAMLWALSGGTLARSDEPHGIITGHLDSNLLVRTVINPTRAALDWAVFHNNPLLAAAPRSGGSIQTRKPEFTPDLFHEAFVEGSAKPVPDFASLSGPLAWPLLFNWLEREDFPGTEGLAEVLSSIARERWGGKRPAQEVSSAYLSSGPGESPALWLTVEFLPGVETGRGFGDSDADGRPDFTAQVKPELLGGSITSLLQDYISRPLAPDEIEVWATEIASLWYNKYQTYSLSPESLEGEDALESEIPEAVRARIRELAPVGSAPAVLLRGKPAGSWIYNALFVKRSPGENAPSGFRKALETLLEQTPPEQRVIEAGGALFLRDSVEAALSKPSLDKPGGPFDFIKAMSEALAARRIKLILAPVPLKEFVLADTLAPGAGGAKALEADFRSYIKKFETAGITVADLAPAFRESPSFLANDTHWTPAAAARAAEIVARSLWKFISANAAPRTASEHGMFNMAGDLREMLPVERVREYPPMQVEFIRPVLADSILDDSNPSAPVLVVSDSFGVVFQRSTPTRAGFVAHLAAQIASPVELVASQGSPVQAVRDLLRKGPEHLEGRSAVVFLFSERFLHGGVEWKPLQWPAPSPSVETSTATGQGEEGR